MILNPESLVLMNYTIVTSVKNSSWLVRVVLRWKLVDLGGFGRNSDFRGKSEFPRASQIPAKFAANFPRVSQNPPLASFQQPSHCLKGLRRRRRHLLPAKVLLRPASSSPDTVSRDSGGIAGTFSQPKSSASQIPAKISANFPWTAKIPANLAVPGNGRHEILFFNFLYVQAIFIG